LCHIDDLPFDPKNDECPHVYGRFREKTRDIKIRPLFPTPKNKSLGVYPMKTEKNVLIK